jgi:hypothetical protein
MHIGMDVYCLAHDYYLGCYTKQRSYGVTVGGQLEDIEKIVDEKTCGVPWQKVLSNRGKSW